VRQVLQLSGGTKLHLETMEGLVREVERICGVEPLSGSTAAAPAGTAAAAAGAEEGAVDGSVGGEGDAGAPLAAEEEVGGEGDAFTVDFPALELMGVLAAEDTNGHAEAAAQGEGAAREDGAGSGDQGSTASIQEGSTANGGSAAGGSGKYGQEVAAARDRVEEQIK
jgi:hypothetical protein